MGWNLGQMFSDIFVDKGMKNQLKSDTLIPEQQMTPEEQQLLASQMGGYNRLGRLSPMVMAQMGLIYDKGKYRAITDNEAKAILPADQYAIWQAKQQEAQSLSSGMLPDYMKREMEGQNNQILGAANRKLGPGGYYMSTPGNEATRLVTQNVADTAIKNRERQLGLLSGYYGLSSGIAEELPKYTTGLLNAGQSIAKNMIQPFHEWSSANRMQYSKGLADIGQAGVSALGSVGSSAMGGATHKK